MKTYSRMPDEATARVTHLVKLFHRDLLDAGVRFDLLSVSHDKEGHCLKHSGYPADAVVRATSIKERTKGAGDVEILVDEARYLGMTEAEKDALLDHEIEHVELKIDKKTERVKLDCRGRPKVGMRKHDVQIGWFASIAQRHGIASGEVKQATRIWLDGQQTFFAFLDQPVALNA